MKRKNISLKKLEQTSVNVILKANHANYKALIHIRREGLTQ
jgi:hypothetical protein